MKLIKFLHERTIERSHVVRTHHPYHYQATHKVLHMSRTPRLYHAASSKIYGKLDHAKHEIRVIKIEPGQWDDEMSCRLKVVSLDRLLRPRYDTLSYTWGSSKNTRTITIDKQDIDVSTNLFTALRALRHTSRTVTIWADALCIDQNNNCEKNKQVALMGKIYRQGRQTWVSLGCPDEKWADRSWSPASHLLEKTGVLKRLVRGLWRLFWHHLILRRSWKSRLGVNHISDARRLMAGTGSEDSLDGPDKENQRIAASMLTWLATHDYWSRVWVVQEIALSKIDPICIFGRHQVPLLSLDTVFSDWASGDVFTLTSRRVSWSPEVGKGVDRAQEMCLLRDEFLTMRSLRLSGRMEILRALQLASYRHASVAHDHIYGLRSLLPANEQDSLQPDYNLSVRELFASVTKHLLHKGKSISLLCAAIGTNQQNEHGLPSWSLEFSKPLRLPDRGASLSEFEDHNGDDVREFDVLCLQGNKLGEQITAYAPREYTFDDLPSYEEILKFRTKDIYDEDTYRRGWASQYTNTYVDHQQGRDSSSVELPTTPAEHVERGLDTEGYMVPRYVLFSTDQGRIGKCANDVQQGDEIWAFAGSKTAFVLRPLPTDAKGQQVTNRCKLVGPCDFLNQSADPLDSSEHGSQAIEIV